MHYKNFGEASAFEQSKPKSNQRSRADRARLLAIVCEVEDAKPFRKRK